MAQEQKTFDISDIRDLQNITKKLSKSSKGGEIFALIGQLGAGKTTFSKEFLKASGVTKAVSSPTFVLMVPYPKGKKTFYHLDLYRISNSKDIFALGLHDIWNDKTAISLIEWADKIKRHLPKSSILLKFSFTKENKRLLTIKNAPDYFNF